MTSIIFAVVIAIWFIATTVRALSVNERLERLEFEKASYDDINATDRNVRSNEVEFRNKLSAHENRLTSVEDESKRSVLILKELLNQLGYNYRFTLVNDPAAIPSPCSCTVFKKVEVAVLEKTKDKIKK